MAVGTETELLREIERLRAELARREQEAADKERQLERYAADLRETFKQERARSQQLRESYMATVRALSNAVEARDAYTGKHAERVAAYGLGIAKALGLKRSNTPEIEFGFLLHDIGKVAIADAILYKPDVLTEKERALMEQHPVIGARDRSRHRVPRRGKRCRPAPPRALGRRRLSGRAVRRGDPAHRPRVRGRRRARRAHDRRPYRPASTLSDARRMIVEKTGTQFDPRVIEAFRSIPDETFERIASEIR